MCADAPTTSSPFSAPQPEPSPLSSLGLLRETESNSVSFEVKSLQDHAPGGRLSMSSGPHVKAIVVDGTNGPDTKAQVTIPESLPTVHRR